MSHARSVRQVASTLCLLAIAIQGAAKERAPVQTVDAIWHVQQLRLSFRSPRTYYSCDALKHKIAAVLTALGAHENIHVHVPCRLGVLTNNAVAIITLATPLEATLANVEAATTYSSEQQLVARVRNVQLPSANDVERFAAEWHTVALHHERNLRLKPTDCDLLQNLSAQVFPQLGVQMEEPLKCSSSGLVRMKPKMHVKALFPAPLPDGYVAEERQPQ